MIIINFEEKVNRVATLSIHDTELLQLDKHGMIAACKKINVMSHFFVRFYVLKALEMLVFLINTLDAILIPNV